MLLCVDVYRVVAVRREVDALEEGCLRQLRPGQLRARGAQRRQARVYLLAGVDDRHAVEVGAGGGGGGGVGLHTHYIINREGLIHIIVYIKWVVPGGGRGGGGVGHRGGARLRCADEVL
jgi:hypothetical protein